MTGARYSSIWPMKVSFPCGSAGILVDTFYRYVGDHEIVILKRNERRFWTRTAAREDAEATMLRLMNESGADTKHERHGASLRSCSSGRARNPFLNVIRRALEILRANRLTGCRSRSQPTPLLRIIGVERELDPKASFLHRRRRRAINPILMTRPRRAGSKSGLDFQWGFFDLHEPDVRRSAKQFVVECKRLGDSGRKDWVLNENYVAHGVARLRFARMELRTAVPSALMIGYWRNMDIATILTEVNCAATAHFCLSWSHTQTISLVAE